MRCYDTSPWSIQLPEGHRFPITKYQLLADALRGRPGIELVLPEPATLDQLHRAHEARWVQKVIEEDLDARDLRRIGFPATPGMGERSRRSVGASTQAATWVREHGGVAANLAGGTHHVMPTHGHGYGLLNDFAVAIRDQQHLDQLEGRERHYVVIDVDVHQGNGTAYQFREDPNVTILSINEAPPTGRYRDPSTKDWNLPKGTTDAGYLQAVDELTEDLRRIEPDQAFVVLGVDPHHDDTLGSLHVTVEGLRERDVRISRTLARLGTPTTLSMGGGYQPNVEQIVAMHVQGILAYRDAFEGTPS